VTGERGVARLEAASGVSFQHITAARAETGKEFEAGLLALLFDDPELRRWVREYLVF
jgi:hypothetical protein